MYGRKQSSRDWYLTLRNLMNDLGFDETIIEPCLFTKRGVVVCCHVDDRLLIAKKSKLIEYVEQCIAESYQIKRNGDLSKFLGIIFTRDKLTRSFTMSQETAIQDLALKFKVTSERPPKQPLKSNKFPDGIPADSGLYMAIIGSLLYVARMTRPDVMAAVSMLSRYAQNPNEHHYQAATKTVKMKLGGAKDDNVVVAAYADSDWPGYEEKSRMGYLVKIGDLVLQTANSDSQVNVRYPEPISIKEDNSRAKLLFDITRHTRGIPLRVTPAGHRFASQVPPTVLFFIATFFSGVWTVGITSSYTQNRSLWKTGWAVTIIGGC
ncbi:DNA-directed DNA polymerase [Synchytrium endobioticum]|uniref:DNA-directed DNA polymerase n=1 Tax=Synchytrium endobioticum TaxID=286115 RepID=A0A507CXM5_9FUNG|nr:DNA-directed DNA polymerase [Synchytrium endobioticum]TPX43630.1 DNA-directed DNA polymerase [Synchytrium endobioticum]